MKFRKLLKILIGLLFLFAAVVGVTSVKHPIVKKWLTGSAKCVGKPIQATVYTDGKINHAIRVFYVDKYWGSNKKNNSYLLSLSEYDSLRMLKFFNIDLNEKWIGRPVGTSNRDYDFIAGYLFQSDVGGHFSPFQDKMKGFDFDPQLWFDGNQIKFNLPPNTLKFDSIRIELP